MFYKKKCEQSAFVPIVVLIFFVHSSVYLLFQVSDKYMFIHNTDGVRRLGPGTQYSETNKKKALTAVVYAVIAFDYVM
jgi:hypothetical protein